MADRSGNAAVMWQGPHSCPTTHRVRTVHLVRPSSGPVFSISDMEYIHIEYYSYLFTCAGLVNLWWFEKYFIFSVSLPVMEETLKTLPHIVADSLTR